MHVTDCPSNLSLSDSVPDISEATIQRLVKRDFPTEISDRVESLFASYGVKPHHFERNRVRAAEYPSQMKIGYLAMQRIGPERLQDLRESDWQEYSARLARE